MMARNTIALLLWIFASTSLWSQVRGYQERECGFDLDGDGIIGEVADDCTICDGNTSTGAFTVDPDGDATEEDINFVDSAVGVNDVNCGAPDDACATIDYVLAGSNSSYTKRVDGPGDGAEDVICVSGTHNISSTITFNVDGVTGTYVRDGFTFPSNPFMVVGWDVDRDGSYPPFDTDDTAVVSGQGTLDLCFTQDSVDNFEMAHLTVQDCGSTGATRGFFDFGATAFAQSYFHDLQLLRINEGLAATSGTIVFNGFVNDNIVNTAIINCQIDDYGGYLLRGSKAGGGDWNFRMQNVSTTLSGLTGDLIPAVKPWGAGMQALEFLDNIFDADPAGWTTNGTETVTMFGLAQCTQNVVIRNNLILNFTEAFGTQPFASGFCTARDIDNITFDRNEVRFTTTAYTATDAMWIGGSEDVTTTENITISNNFISTTQSWDACIILGMGTDLGVQSGTAEVVGNTCSGNLDNNSIGAVHVGSPAGNFTNMQQNITFSGNIITNTGGLASDRNVLTTYAPSSWSADGNTYDPDAEYDWNGNVETAIAGWRTQSGGDTNGQECTPTFVNAAGGDFHLDAGDTCALDEGVDITAIVVVDYDNDTRPSNNSDSGADEVITSPSTSDNLLLSPNL